MSLWETIVPDSYQNREQRQNELLTDIRTGIANIAAQEGETELITDLSQKVLHDYISVPESGDLLGVPAGHTTVDFENGKVTNSALSEPLTTDMRTVSDLAKDAGRLRSFSLGVDAPGKLRLGKRDWVAVDPGVYNVAAQIFSSFEFKSEMPAALNFMVSTRSDPFVQGTIETNLLRKGAASGQLDAWNPVDLYPRDLLNYMSGAEAQSYGQPIVPNAGPDRTTIIVENTGSNDIDAAIFASELFGENWYDIGATSTNISPGNHTVFGVHEAHNFLQPRVTNSTNGNNVAVNVEIHGDA